jgi:taurine dioxygenase
MKISLPEKNSIGAEITNTSIMALTDSEIKQIKELLYLYKLIIFRGQDPSDQEYIEFSKKLGTPQIYVQAHYHHPEHPEIFVSSNELWNGKKFGVAGTGRYWHTDYSFMNEPLPLTMILPKRIPQGSRGTFYVDMQKIYEELPDDMRQAIEGRRAIHEGRYRYKIQATDIDRSILEILEQCEKEFPAVTHPCIIQHPITKAKILYVNEGFTTGIEGLPYETSRSLLKKLLAHITQEKNIYKHTWVAGDLLLWDNRSLIHHASSTPKGEYSTSYRIGVYDGLPFYG